MGWEDTAGEKAGLLYSFPFAMFCLVPPHRGQYGVVGAAWLGQGVGVVKPLHVVNSLKVGILETVMIGTLCLPSFDHLNLLGEQC